MSANEKGAPRQESAQEIDHDPITPVAQDDWDWRAAWDDEMLASDNIGDNSALRVWVSDNMTRYLRFLAFRNGAWIEFQAINITGKRKAYGDLGTNAFAFCNSYEAAIALALEGTALDVSADGVFAIGNALNPEITHRATANTWHKAGRTNTSDKDIVHRRAIFLDADSVRPSGISAAAAELEYTLRRTFEMYAWCCEHIGAEYLGIGMSGNGGQVHIALDFPVCDESTEMLKEVLTAISLNFSDREDAPRPATKIDVFYEPKRLGPAWGTRKRKGAHSAERPHRRTFFVCPPQTKRLTLDQLRDVHARIVTDEVRAAMNAKDKKRSAKSAAKIPVGKSDSQTAQPSGDSIFAQLEAIATFSQVAEILGIDTTKLTCFDAKCQATDVKIYDSGLHCFHATCKQLHVSAPDLVARHVFGEPIAGSKGIVGKLVEWYREHFPEAQINYQPRGPKPESTADTTEVEITALEADCNDEAIAALATYDDSVYQRAGYLCRILRDGKSQRLVISDLSQSTLRERLSRYVFWYVWVRDEKASEEARRDVFKQKRCHPPDWSAPAIYNRVQWAGSACCTA